MSDNLQNANELIEELEKLSIRTSAGAFVKLEDVRRLTQKKQEAEAIEGDEIPQRMKVEQARGMAKEHLKSLGFAGKTPPDVGRSLPATDPHPPSRA